MPLRVVNAAVPLSDSDDDIDNDNNNEHCSTSSSKQATCGSSSSLSSQDSRRRCKAELPPEIKMLILEHYLANITPNQGGQRLTAEFTELDETTDDQTDAFYSHCNSIPLLNPRVLRCLLHDPIFDERTCLASQERLVDMFLRVHAIRGLVIDEPGQIQYLFAVLGPARLHAMQLVHVPPLFFMLNQHGAACICNTCTGSYLHPRATATSRVTSLIVDSWSTAVPNSLGEGDSMATLVDGLAKLFTRADVVIQLPLTADIDDGHQQQRQPRWGDPLPGQVLAFSVPDFVIRCPVLLFNAVVVGGYPNNNHINSNGSSINTSRAIRARLLRPIYHLPMMPCLRWLQYWPISQAMKLKCEERAMASPSWGSSARAGSSSSSSRHDRDSSSSSSDTSRYRRVLVRYSEPSSYGSMLNKAVWKYGGQHCKIVINCT